MFKSISKTPDSPTVTTSFGPNKKKTKKASLQAIEAAIERIKAEVPKPRPEQPYIFIRTVYEEFLGLRDRPKWKSIAREIYRDRGIKKTKTSDFLRYLIDKAAQGAVEGQKSKYITILRYARKKRINPRVMIEFVKNQGTINKAVEFIRMSKKSKKYKVSKSAAKGKRTK